MLFFSCRYRQHEMSVQRILLFWSAHPHMFLQSPQSSNMKKLDNDHESASSKYLMILHDFILKKKPTSPATKKTCGKSVNVSHQETNSTNPDMTHLQVHLPGRIGMWRFWRFVGFRRPYLGWINKNPKGRTWEKPTQNGKSPRNFKLWTNWVGGFFPKPFWKICTVVKLGEHLPQINRGETENLQNLCTKNSHTKKDQKKLKQFEISQLPLAEITWPSRPLLGSAHVAYGSRVPKEKHMSGHVEVFVVYWNIHNLVVYGHFYK